MTEQIFFQRRHPNKGPAGCPPFLLRKMQIKTTDDHCQKQNDKWGVEKSEPLWALLVMRVIPDSDLLRSVQYRRVLCWKWKCLTNVTVGWTFGDISAIPPTREAEAKGSQIQGGQPGWLRETLSPHVKGWHSSEILCSISNTPRINKQTKLGF